MADKEMTALSEELVRYLQGERMVTVASIDAENGSPNVLCISWLLATDASTLRFAIDGRSKLLTNVDKDDRVTVTVIGLGTCYAITGRAKKYVDKLEGCALNMAGVEIKVEAVRDVMFYGGKVTTEPTFDKTYDKALAEKYDNEIYTALKQ
ncbi:MAG TPA: pyridoxamine 5'-phosphate oxidase family protein [Bacilli bacterium]|nr:pyridoxamine 5'-phosphate oxidase family protein [Bacilli bacterium]